MFPAMVNKFTGRDIFDKPACPFCGIPILRPEEPAIPMPNEMPVGACGCGAVYACDVTGHNLGTAMIDALVFGCKGDWDLAWDLLPEEDYVERVIHNYDLESHLIVHGGAFQGRNVSGALYFIRLRRDVREVPEEGPRKPLERAAPKSPGSSSKKRGKKSFTKEEVEALVGDYEMDALLTLAEEDRRIIRDLQRLLYSVDDLMRRRAAEALGRVSALIARRDPGTISKLLQGFFSSLSDTASSSWGALDAIGEIISNSPELFAGHVPRLYGLTRDRALLKDLLRVLGMIGAARPDLIHGAAFRYIPLLKDPDPAIRGYTALLLGNSRTHEAKEDLLGLQDDPAEMVIYRDGELENRTVGQMVLEAVKKI
jgi:hypothetical protein